MAKGDIPLNGEVADSICVESLKFHIGYLEKEVARLKKIRPATNFSKAELGDMISMLTSMNDVLVFYGGNNDNINSKTSN